MDLRKGLEALAKPHVVLKAELLTFRELFELHDIEASKLPDNILDLEVLQLDIKMCANNSSDLGELSAKFAKMIICDSKSQTVTHQTAPKVSSLPRKRKIPDEEGEALAAEIPNKKFITWQDVMLGQQNSRANAIAKDICTPKEAENSGSTESTVAQDSIVEATKRALPNDGKLVRSSTEHSSQGAAAATTTKEQPVPSAASSAPLTVRPNKRRLNRNAWLQSRAGQSSLSVETQASVRSPSTPKRRSVRRPWGKPTVD